MWGFERSQLRRRNDARLWDACHPEDARLIRRIRGKLTTPQISPFEQELVTRDLLDRAQQARDQGGTLAQALGESTEDFCRGVLDTCVHTGTAERAQQAARRLLLNLALLLAPCALYWLMSYDRMLWAQSYTGQDWGLRGRWIMLLPVNTVGVFAAFLVLEELWDQLASARLAHYRHGQVVCVLVYLALYAATLASVYLLPEDTSRSLLPIDLRVAAPVYAILLAATCLISAWHTHRLSRALARQPG